MTSTLNKFFDHIFCLNLDERTDRWEKSQAEFAKHGIENVERFSAIRGTSLNLPLSNNVDERGFVHPPHVNGINVAGIGGNMSHLFMLRTAKRSGYKNVLLLEDDVVFHEDLNIEFAKAIDQLPENWDMLYFGGNHFSCKPVKVTKHLYAVRNTVCLHAVAVNYSIYDRLIAKLVNVSQPTDCNYADLQATSKCFVINPHLAWQRGGYSDVQTSVQGYEFLQHFETAQN